MLEIPILYSCGLTNQMGPRLPHCWSF